jgi:hypothetical protein
MRNVGFLFLLLTGCGASRTPAAHAPAPMAQEPPPLAASLELRPDETEALRARLATGVVVARLAEKPVLLSSCRSPITYRHASAAGSATRDPASKQALAAPRFDESFARTGALTFSPTGDRLEANRHLDDHDWLDGQCTGATHYVEAVSFEPRGAMGAVARLSLRPLPHPPCPRYSVFRGGTCRSDADGVAPEGREPYQVAQQGHFPPGLVPGQVEEFVRPRERELAAACWDGRHEEWSRASVQYSLSVDPGGTVFPAPDADGVSHVTAELGRGDVTTSGDELGKCVKAIVDRWRFPRANTPTWLLLGFDFRR